MPQTRMRSDGTFKRRNIHVYCFTVLCLPSVFDPGAKMFYTCGPNEAMVVSGMTCLSSIQHDPFQQQSTTLLCQHGHRLTGVLALYSRSGCIFWFDYIEQQHRLKSEVLALFIAHIPASGCIGLPVYNSGLHIKLLLTPRDKLLVNKCVIRWSYWLFLFCFPSPGFGRSPPLMIAGGRVFVFPCIQQLQRWSPFVFHESSTLKLPHLMYWSGQEERWINALLCFWEGVFG